MLRAELNTRVRAEIREDCAKECLTEKNADECDSRREFGLVAQMPESELVASAWCLVKDTEHEARRENDTRAIKNDLTMI